MTFLTSHSMAFRMSIDDPADVFPDLRSNTYSQDSKEDLKDTKSIVNPFFNDTSIVSTKEWDDDI